MTDEHLNELLRPLFLQDPFAIQLPTVTLQEIPWEFTDYNRNSMPIQTPKPTLNQNPNQMIDAIPIRFRGPLKSATPERPFQCELCTFGFKRPQDLKRHIQRHFMQFRPYMCSNCGTKFTRSDALARHVQKVKCKAL